MIHILNAEPEGYNPAALSVLQGIGHVDQFACNRGSLIESLPHYDVLIVRLGHRVDREVLDAGKKLKAIVTATTGLNHIDLDVAKSRGIEVLSLKGETEFLKTVHATAEHTLALLLSLTRHIPFAHRHVINGGWNRDLFKGIELEGKTLGVIGYGRLGQKVAAYAHALGMTILAYDIKDISYDPFVQKSDLDSLIQSADVISLHITSCPENSNFFGSPQIFSMKAGSYLVNTARGDVLDQAALLDALKSGYIRGAALDVLAEEYEGNLAKSPLIEYARTNDNLVITPHIGGATIDSMHKTELFMAKKLKAYLSTL